MHGGVVLMGGGTDVDEAFVWMCSRAPGGDFLVIRTTGTDAYNPYIFQLCNQTVNSVATLIIPDGKDANSSEVLGYMQHAEMVWIAGGDQSTYLNYWTNTSVQLLLRQRSVQEGMPIGGTSAGMNVQSQFIYSAEMPDGVTSPEALRDPFNRLMTFARDWLQTPALRGVIVDPHFVTRDRMGRDLAFLCRVWEFGWADKPRSIAVDENTALLLANVTSTVVSVVGSSTAYFLQASGKPEVCERLRPLTYQNVTVYRIKAGDSFDLSSWTGKGGEAYQVSANQGVLTSTQSGGSPY